MFPLALGALAGIPVIDADGIGRAFPHLEMTTFSIGGCCATPSVLVDDSGNTVIVDARPNRLVEDVVRGIAAALGAAIYGSFYPMTGQEMKRTAVRDTLTQTYVIGRAIRLARQAFSDPVEGLLAGLRSGDASRKARLLFDGKIIDVTHETREGWHWGKAVLTAANGPARQLVIEIQNEYVVARLDARTVAIVPDLISVVDRESAEPLTAEMLRYGQRVAVIGYGAPAQLRTPEALAVVGPRLFGLAEEFLPIEQLG